MDVNCEGCAGCCIDWRPVAPTHLDHERRDERRPLDDTYNLAPLFRDEIQTLLDSGLGDAMTPRLWRAASPDEAVTLDGIDVAGVNGRPVFFVGLRKVPKPVAPFGLDRTWLDTCVFLDPETLRCRVHGGDVYPRACDEYPGQNLKLGKETECERVESVHGGTRLQGDDVPDGLRPPLFGPQALGTRLFCHPDPETLDGAVERIARGEATATDRAEFVGVAVGSSPGRLEVNESKAADARERALAADSWVGRAATEWDAMAGDPGSRAGIAVSAADVERRRGAPETDTW